MNTYLIASLMSIVSGFCIGTYKEFAQIKSWPIGKFYFNNGGWIAIISLISIVTGSIELFHLTQWFYVLLLIVVSFGIAAILTILLKQNIQWIAFIFLIASFLIYTIGGAEIIDI